MTGIALKLHPKVADDLVAIASMVEKKQGKKMALSVLDEIETALRDVEHGEAQVERSNISPGLSNLVAGRRGVGAVRIDAKRRQAVAYAISYDTRLG